MKLLTQRHRDQLLRNGAVNAARSENGETEADFLPVVKLFTPDANCTWLLSELDPTEPDIAFGLCDLGMGCAELGSVRISELAASRGALGLPVERDRHFSPTHTIAVYASAAWNAGGITENPQALAKAASERSAAI